MKKRIISLITIILTLIIILAFTINSTVVTRQNASSKAFLGDATVTVGDNFFARFRDESIAGDKLNGIAQDAATKSPESKYSADTVISTNNTAPSAVEVCLYGTPGSKQTLYHDAGGYNIETLTETNENGETKQYLEYAYTIGTISPRFSDIATFIYKNMVKYNGKTYHIRLDLEEINNVSGTTINNEVRVRLGSRTPSETGKYDQKNYTPVKPMIGLLYDDSEVRVTINYSIVDDDYNPVSVAGAFAVTDIDSAQGIYLQNYEITKQNARAYMNNISYNNLYYQNRKGTKPESTGGAYVFSYSKDDNGKMDTDKPSSDCTAYFLMDGMPSTDHIHAVMTWDLNRAYSSLYFKDIRKNTTPTTANYTVKHWFETDTGSYAVNNTYTENKSGTVGTTATATPLSTATLSSLGYAEYTSAPDRKSNGTITADGNLTLQFFYKKIYNITYETNGGTNNSENPATYTNGSAITFKEPTRTGYTFKGWYEDSSLITPKTGIVSTDRGDKKVYAKWEVPYKAEFYYQNLQGTYDLKNTLNLSAQPGSTVTLRDLDNESGYKLNKQHPSYKDSGTVTDDGSLVLKIYYDLVEYNINYELDGGTNNSSNPAKYTIKSNEINFQNPTKTGYTFGGWYSDAGCKNPKNSIPINSTGDVTVYAKWTPEGNTPYKVEHYLQQSGSNYTLKETENKTGTNGSTVTANPKTTFAGYTENTSHSGRKASGTVSADGSLTLKLYYDKINYDIEYVLNGGTNASSNPAKYTIDEAITFDEPTRSGYNFKGWFSDSACTTPKTSIEKGSTGKVTVYAKWEKIPDTPNTAAYTVEHYIENSDGSYSKKNDLTENSTGTVGQTATATAKTIEGYEENTSHSDRKSSGAITSDGKLVLKLYYNRKEYKIEYDLDGGTNNTENPSKYKTGDVVEFKTPTKSGYTFKGWYLDSSFNTPKSKIENEIGDKKVYAKWEIVSDIPYKVEHYKETTKGNYELVLTDDLKGELGKEVTAVAKTYDGYTENKNHSSRIASGVVKQDGSLVLKLYYDKLNYTVKFNTDGGSPTPATQTVAYGDRATTPTVPTKLGYTFDGWVDEDGKIYSFDTLVSRNIKLTARWTPVAKGNSDDGEKTQTKETKASETNQKSKPSVLPKTGFGIAMMVLAIVTLAVGGVSGFRYFKINKMIK